MITKKDFASIKSDDLFVEFAQVGNGDDFDGKYVEGDENYEWKNWMDCKIKLTVENYSFSLRYLIVKTDEHSQEEDLYLIPERDEFKSIVKYEKNGQLHEYETTVWKEDKLLSSRILKNANLKLWQALHMLCNIVLDEDKFYQLFGEFNYDTFRLLKIERKISFQEIEDVFSF